MKNIKFYKPFFLIAALILFLILGIDLYKKNILLVKQDWGDAPTSYGKAIHLKPNDGPYFGNNRGDDDTKNLNNSIPYALGEALNGINDDAFPSDMTYSTLSQIVDSATKPFLAPDIIVEKSNYSIDLPLNNALKGDPVRGWIDFNGNEKFDESEKATATYLKNNVVNLNWRLPLYLSPCLTYLRIRTCSKLYKEEIESSSETVHTGEAEDYLIRIVKNIIPTSEIKEYIDFIPFVGKNDPKELLSILNNLNLGDKQFSIQLSKEPEIIAINNLHDASFIGLRIGHEDTTNITPENPIVVTLKSSHLLEQLNFQIIDIDGGDRIKIQGFHNGKLVSPTIDQITDNFYHHFNQETSEVFSNQVSDAGNGLLAPSSFDMAVQVTFNGKVDSVLLTYTDDGLKTSGTFSLGKISIRKFNYPDPLVTKFETIESLNAEQLNWNTSFSNNLKSYTIQRSVDNISFDNVTTNNVGKDSVFSYTDNNIADNVNYYYYRIKNTQTDDHISYSKTYRIKRNQSNSTNGFKAENMNFINNINLILLKNMPNAIVLNLYDYNGKKAKQWNFENKKEKDIITLINLESLVDNIYYLELINNNQKYMVELNKGSDAK
jgi:GEVED domain